VQRNFTFSDDGPLPRLVSPDGDLLVLPAGKDKVAFRNTATGARVGPPLDHAGSSGVLVFSPGSRLFVTALGEREVRVWDVGTCRPIGEPLRHPEQVLRVDFSPNGRLLATVSGPADRSPREVRLWRVPSGELIGGPLRSESPILALAWAPGGKRLLAECGDHARVWESASGRPLGRIERFRGPGAFSPDGRIVLSRADERTLRLWDAVSGLPLGEPLRHPAALLDVAFSADGKAVVTLGGDGHLRTWRLPSPEADAPGRVTLRLEAQTGLTMDEGGVIAELSPEQWHERLRRLQEPAGP
jgi:WD40 repeat protein